MCGRMTLYDIDQIQVFLEMHFNVSKTLDFKPRYNIAPKQEVLSVIYDGNKFRVGYIPWGLNIKTKDKTFFNINAKKESLQSFYYFKELYLNKRVLCLLNGYYEWQDQGDYKSPFYLYPKNHELMLSAALFDKVEDAFGLTLITTNPIESIQSIHYRMPMLLTPQEGINYLVKGILPQSPSVELSYHEVSHKVNMTKYDDYDLIKPMDAFIID